MSGQGVAESAVRTCTSAWSSTRAMARKNQRACSITQAMSASIHWLSGATYSLG